MYMSGDTQAKRDRRAGYLAPLILREVFLMSSGRAFASLSLGLLGVFVQTICFLVLISSASNPDQLKVAINNLGLGQISDFLEAYFQVAAWGVICCLFFLGSLIEHQSKKMTAELAVEFEDYSIAAELKRAVNAGDPVTSANCRQFLARGPHYLGRVVLEFFWNAAPFGAGMVALIALLFLDGMLVLGIFVVGVLSAPLLLSANKFAVNSTKRLVARSRAHALQRKDLAHAFDATKTNAALSERVYSDELYKTAYQDRLVATHVSLLSAKLVIALMLIVASVPLFIVSRDIGTGDSSLGVQVVLLLTVLAGLRGAFKFFTKFNIFYPYFSTYKDWSNARQVPEMSSVDSAQERLKAKLATVKALRDDLSVSKKAVSDQLREEKMRVKALSSELSSVTKALKLAENSLRKRGETKGGAS